MQSPPTPSLSKANAHFKCTESLNDETAWRLICQAGVTKGSVFSLTRGENIIGRGDNATIQISDILASRSHLRIFCADSSCMDNAVDCYVEDIGSTNGTRVNGELLQGVLRLKTDDLIELGTTAFKAEYRPYVVDPGLVTKSGAPNLKTPVTTGHETPASSFPAAPSPPEDLRKLLHDRLHGAVAEARTSGRTFSFLYVDIDDLEAVNHLHGRGAGDQALIHLQNLLITCCGPSHTVQRYHEDEFAVIMPEVDKLSCDAIAEKFRESVEANPFTTNGKVIHLTVSIGATEMKLADTPESIFDTAKRYAVSARIRGGNRVICS